MQCPICDKNAAKAYHPFCSRRCADVDLGKWFSEGYSLPSDEQPEPDESNPQTENPTDRLH